MLQNLGVLGLPHEVAVACYLAPLGVVLAPCDTQAGQLGASAAQFDLDPLHGGRG